MGSMALCSNVHIIMHIQSSLPLSSGQKQATGVAHSEGEEITQRHRHFMNHESLFGICLHTLVMFSASFVVYFIPLFFLESDSLFTSFFFLFLAP